MWIKEIPKKFNVAKIAATENQHLSLGTKEKFKEIIEKWKKI